MESATSQASWNGKARDREDQAIVPPYWQHRRYESYSSVNIIRPSPIILEDHTEEPSDKSHSLWAQEVSIDDHVLISGNVPGVGDYVVWNCKVDMLDVSACSS